ncbi:MAG TPA: hypothetical protein VFB38_16250 [Chthonomonadaceae bacterium]|nr:hypothetical protein [Chthonomonadaceae bacterium]
MATKLCLSPSQKEHMEQKLAEVERLRSQPFDEAEVERILADMQSDDEVTRAKAVRQICPCRMPWEVFYRLRQAAKRLQKDPSPMVRAHARHIEEDAREVASLESLSERLQEFQDTHEVKQEGTYRPGKRRKRRP